MMKTIEYYMELPYKIEIIPDTAEGGYGARIPELPGCVTCGDTMEIAIKNAKEAKREWILSALEDGIAIPEPQPEGPVSNFSVQFKLRIPRTLHKALAMQARKEGISMNQYCMYLLSSNYATHTAKSRL